MPSTPTVPFTAGGDAVGPNMAHSSRGEAACVRSVQGGDEAGGVIDWPCAISRGGWQLARMGLFAQKTEKIDCS